jgi:hypothetical protein
MTQRLLTTAALAGTLLGGILTAGSALAYNSNDASAWEPKPFHATGDVRSVDPAAMRLEMKTKRVQRHFPHYTLAPGVMVQGPGGPEQVRDIQPKMRVRLVGVRAPGDTWTVNQIQVLPRGAGNVFPKPFDATGDVRFVSVDGQRLDLKAHTAPRHFRVYALNPDVVVVGPRGPARLSDVTPERRVRLIGQREADNTWTVEQIQILP